MIIVIYEIITNEILISCVAATLLSQVLKFIIELLNKGKKDYSLLFETGGMPSSHAGLVSALLLSLYFVDGFSVVFIVALIFGLIVIRDAFGIRRQSGEQAKIINHIIFNLKLEKKLKIKRLRELVGHTTIQVIAGLLVGGIVAVIVHIII
jgi:acid phosphatase family membrane protein YuiD